MTSNDTQGRLRYKEFRVQMRLRNNLIIERREALGLSAAEAASRIGISYGLYLNYESLKTAPIAKIGGWKGTALQVAQFYAVGPESLWPADVLLVKTVRAEREVGEEDLLKITGGNRALEKKVGP